MAKERNKFEFPETFKVSCLIKSPKQYNVEELIKIIGNKILRYDKANIIIQYNDKILNKFSTKELELQALLDKSIVPHTYSLIVRKYTSESLEMILCHEMKHFDQYEKKELQLEKTDTGLIYIYKGVKYNQNTDYYSRPWEQEAYNAQTVLWKQFKEIYYK